MTGLGEKDLYVVTDLLNAQIVIVDKEQHVVTRHKDRIQGMKLGGPRDVTTDPQGRILIADYSQNQVLMMNREGDEVRQLIRDQEMRNPGCLSLDTVHHRMYVSGRAHEGTRYVFVYDNNLPLHAVSENTFREFVTTMDLTVQL